MGLAFQPTTPNGPSRERRRAYIEHRFGGTQSVVDYLERRAVDAYLGRLPRSLCVLDVPSGYGRFTPQLRAAGHRVVSADLVRKRLSHLACAEGDDRLRLPLVQVDLRGTLPFAPESFDLVFAFRYLHHLKRPEQRQSTVRELIRVSRRWLIVTYYSGVVHGLVKRLQYVPRRPVRRITRFTRRAAVLEMCRALGCRVIEDRAILPVVHAQRIALLEKIRPVDGCGYRPSSHCATPPWWEHAPRCVCEWE